MTTTEATQQRSIFQVGYVVPDLEAARDYFENQLGIGPWRTTPRPPVVDRTYRGNPTPDAYEAASFAFVGDLQIEIMQPMVGPSIYQDFLDANPQGGVHRIAILVDDYNQGVESMGGSDAVAQSGRVNDFRFAFFDAPPLGNFIELVYLDDAAQAMLANFRKGNA